MDVPEQARKELEFVFAAHMDEVLVALEEDPIGAAPSTSEPEGEKKPAGAKKPEEVRA